MHRTSLTVCVATFLTTACSSTVTPASAALVCDDARAGEVAFVFHQSEGFFSPYQPHGMNLLVIEGSCRYHVFSRADGSPGELRSGKLTNDELAQLNTDLLDIDYEALDGEQVNFGTGADAWTYTFRRDALEAQCYSNCAPHPVLSMLQARGATWVGRLWERGTSLSGPVDLDGYASVREPIGAPIAWTGEASLSALFTASSHARVDDPEDLTLLRALRSEAAAGNPPLFLEQGGVVFEVGVADVLPFELELFTDRSRPW
jgi:hypothetical protein